MTYPGPSLNLEDDFRLVEIQPGAFDDPIQCSLLSSRLRDAPSYEALSYAWGDPLVNEPIAILDLTGACHELLATTNCIAAMRRIRRLTSSRLVWIDAICIDQNEVNERNHQLGLMAQIYTQANRVLIYLGEASEDSDSAMDWIREIDCPELDVSLPNTWLSPPQRVLRPPTGMIESLLDRPWFHRIWVLQEAMLAQSAKVYCGSKCISWDAFKQFKRFNTTTRWVKPLPYILRRPEIKLIPGVTIGWQVLKELGEARHCQAADARDKVYALMPLFSSGGINLNIQPDYNHSASRVFTEVAMCLMNAIGLKVLCAVRGESSLPGLPSWVPDWSISKTRTTLGFRQTVGNWSSVASYKAGGSNFNNPADSLGGSKDAPPFIFACASPSDAFPTPLILKAFQIGEIIRIGDPCAENDNAPPLQQWKSIAPAADAVESSSRALTVNLHGYAWVNEKPSDRFLSTITAGRIVYPQVLIGAVQMSVTDEGTEMPKSSFRDWSKGLPPSYQQQVKLTLKACRGRRFFVTDTDLLGLAPLEAKNGDVIYIIPGVSVPFVLRKAGDYFTLVGECYVQDVMDGEALEGVDNSKMEEIVIV